MLINLLGNAAKYTEKGFVEARFEKASLTQRETVLVTISDSGPGIEPDRQGTIFRIYETECAVLKHSDSGKLAGLGLAISNKIC